MEKISALRCLQTGVKNITAADFDIALATITSSVQPDDLQKIHDLGK